MSIAIARENARERAFFDASLPLAWKDQRADFYLDVLRLGSRRKRSFSDPSHPVLSLASPRPLPFLSPTYVSTYAWRTRVRVFRCTRVRVDTSLDESLQTEFRFALRVSISHATWSSVFYSSPWDVHTLSPFPGAFRERATTNVRRVARSYTCAQSGSQFERVSGLKIVSRGSRVT